MARTIAIVGESGSGKSTSIGKAEEYDLIGLDPTSTAIINVNDADLPFRNSSKQYKGAFNAGGNYFSTSDAGHINAALQYISDSRPDITTIIIDDWQYSMVGEVFDKVDEKGYAKYTVLAHNVYKTAKLGNSLRKDLVIFILTHSELDNKKNKYKIKTVGQMVDSLITLDGMFSILLYTHPVYDPVTGDTKFNFLTKRRNDIMGNVIPAKAPLGMFEEALIPNDLGLVLKAVKEYFN